MSLLGPNLLKVMKTNSKRFIRATIIIAAALFVTSVSAIAVHGGTIVVPAGGNLQSAINTAQPGDTIIVEAGASYAGDFILPNKTGTAFVTIQSSRTSELPVGVRVSPSQSALFAKLKNISSAEAIIRTSPGAHHYQFVGIEISTATAAKVFDLVRIGTSTQSAAEVPHSIIIDRSYIHGFPTQEVQRGISLNGADVTISNSYISEIHGTGYDTQAICGWNGPGPFKIINNYLEAAGENVMFGGALPSITNLVPANIEIRRNHFFKPLTWKVGHPTYAGIHWSIKNLLEFKNARNVIVDGNVLENCWVDAQVGYAVLFTVRSEEGLAPWATVSNISFTNNVVKNAEHGIQTLGADWDGHGLHESQGGSNLTISNNQFIGIARWFLTLNEFANVVLEHNTHGQGGNIVNLTGNPSTGFVYRNNATMKTGGFGFFGDGVGEGKAALEKYAPGYVMSGNVLAGMASHIYPAGNFYPADLSGLASFKGTDGLVPGYLGATPLPSPTPSATATPVPSPSPTPTATPHPSPTVTPTPLPSPSPTPEPTPVPAPCSMTVSSPVVPAWGTGKLVVTLTNLSGEASTVKATATSGQVTVTPWTPIPISGTSVIAEFKLQAKKKSSSVVVTGPCGSQTVMVNVQ